MINEDVHSKNRVSEFGEVYTPENIVNDMLDLVKDESYKIDSTFLEPSCGDGNFLVKILERKLHTANKLNIADYDRNLFIAVASIYAVDILAINIKQVLKRMTSVINGEYKNKIGTEINTEMGKVLQFLMCTNIICGDAFTGLKGNTREEDIIIAEWNIAVDIVTRKDFTFNSLSDPHSCNIPIHEYNPITFRKVYTAQKKVTKSSNELFDEL